MRDEVIEGLKSARVLLENGWTTGVTARNSRGESVSVFDPTACSFCVLGAVWRVGGLRRFPGWRDGRAGTPSDPCAGAARGLRAGEVQRRTGADEGGDPFGDRRRDRAGEGEGCLMGEVLRDAKE